MNLAPRAALLAGLLALAAVFLTVLFSGFSLLVVPALAGFGLFGVGVYYGQGPFTTLGLAMVATSAALSTGSGPGALATLVGLGVGASAALIVADASWWLRREPQVDPAVVRGLVRTLVPVWVVGGLLGAGAGAVVMAADLVAGPGIWLLPIGVAVAGALVAVVAWVTRSRHPRRDPLTDIRR